LVRDGNTNKQTISDANWRRVVTDFPAKSQAQAALGLGLQTLHRLEREKGHGWLHDRTPTDCRGKSEGIPSVLAQIQERYGADELKALAMGRRDGPPIVGRSIIKFTGEVFRFGFATDPHIGSLYFSEKWFASMYREFKRQRVQEVFYSGDIHDGLNNGRIANHVYELSDIGYGAQLSRSRKLFRRYAEVPHRMIDGNHDRWFTGCNIVEELCASVDDFHYLGQDEGDIKICKARIKLYHGEDGNSYATSYRVQKVVEAFSPGEKPNVLLLGHTHKALYLPERAVHCYSGGCVQAQSAWMRRKRIAAHTGFWIIELVLNDDGVASATGTWHPLYA